MAHERTKGPAVDTSDCSDGLGDQQSASFSQGPQPLSGWPEQHSTGTQPLSHCPTGRERCRAFRLQGSPAAGDAQAGQRPGGRNACEGVASAATRSNPQHLSRIPSAAAGGGSVPVHANGFASADQIHCRELALLA